MTYEAWLWTHGYNYQEIKRDFETLYAHPDRLDLARKYQVDYVVVGPVERRQYSPPLKRIESLFKPVAGGYQTTIYDASTGERPYFERSLTQSRLDDSDLKPGLLRKEFHGSLFLGGGSTEVVDAIDDFQWDRDKPFQTPYSLVWQGFLKVDKEGETVFSLSSDDGSWLLLGGHLVIDNGGIHAIEEKQSAVSLSRGFYKFQMNYFDIGGGATVKLLWKPPGSTLQPIPKEVLFHESQ